MNFFKTVNIVTLFPVSFSLFLFLFILFISLFQIQHHTSYLTNIVLLKNIYGHGAPQTTTQPMSDCFASNEHITSKDPPPDTLLQRKPDPWTRFFEGNYGLDILLRKKLSVAYSFFEVSSPPTLTSGDKFSGGFKDIKNLARIRSPPFFPTTNLYNFFSLS